MYRNLRYNGFSEDYVRNGVLYGKEIDLQIGVHTACLAGGVTFATVSGNGG